MKKNDSEMMDAINKIHAQLILLDKKVDALMKMPSAENTRLPAKPNDHHKERVMYAAICADCRKECKIPFKPSGDRPVYCQDCFSRRKVISMSGISVQSPAPKENPASKPQIKNKKKTATVKKTAGKKKPTPKKK